MVTPGGLVSKTGREEAGRGNGQRGEGGQLKEREAERGRREGGETANEKHYEKLMKRKDFLLG